MKIVINIPEDRYETLKMLSETPTFYLDFYQRLIVNGIPFPKGHGRIGDLDKLQKVLDEYVLDRKDCPLHIASEIYYNIDTFDTIIGADKENE